MEFGTQVSAQQGREANLQAREQKDMAAHNGHPTKAEQRGLIVKKTHQPHHRPRQAQAKSKIPVGEGAHPCAIMLLVLTSHQLFRRDRTLSLIVIVEVRFAVQVGVTRRLLTLRAESGLLWCS